MILKNFIKRLLLETYYSIIYYIPYFFNELFSFKNTIIVRSFLNFKWGKFHKQNWGDDMVYFICNLWFHKEVINYWSSIISRMLHREHYALIGSILQSADKNTIVWGSGLITADEYPAEQPKQICAVRGPLSRKVLEEHGISCPEIYGDPILLMPKFYRPQVQKQYKLGIIPHIYDENNPVLKSFFEQHPEALIISMQNYGDWRDVIDKICSCERILSSSLHGVILSDAYEIPNTWIEFSEPLYGKGFKFRDYFASVNRKTSVPEKIMSLVDMERLLKQDAVYYPISINLNPLIESCPFKLPFNN